VRHDADIARFFERNLASSRFFTAFPLPAAASSSSPARRASIVFSPRLRAASTSQRSAREVLRLGYTSTGT